MKPDRAPSSIWCLSRSNLSAHVRTAPDDRIVIVGPDGDGLGGGFRAAIVLPRKDARLLAKRINECLDATVKR